MMQSDVPLLFLLLLDQLLFHSLKLADVALQGPSRHSGLSENCKLLGKKNEQRKRLSEQIVITDGRWVASIICRDRLAPKESGTNDNFFFVVHHNNFSPKFLLVFVV